jgi:hypothetical protein
MKYISDGTWFDKGTEAKLLYETWPSIGCFRGLRNGEIDEEVCSFDEFEVSE